MIIDALRGVVLDQLGPQPAGLDPNGGIQLGVEIGGPAENISGYLEFLDDGPGIQGSLCQIVQKFTERL